MKNELADAFFGKLQKGIELRLRERRVFRRRLDFDDAAVAGENEIRIDLGFRILNVFEIQDRHALMNAA
jgi:hypothetical protein